MAVCDDEPENHILLKRSFQQLSACTPYIFDVTYFLSGEELLQHYEEHGAHSFHILILDIEMGRVNGIETAKAIRSLPDREVQIIFLTSYPEYMIESFDVQTFHYLIKPVSYELFENKMLKLCSYILSSKWHVSIKTKDGQIVLRSSDIIAIVKAKHSVAQKQLEVITSQQRYTSIGTLSEYSNKPNYPLLLIHRSVIINMEHIRKFTSSSVIMSNQAEFPIGRSQAKYVKDTFARYMITQFRGRG
ncbi:LytTR family DNA-binding domain-containing protein [Paenibacillus sp. BR2-3]|uniref:LytR/AlgR family response regulator transcription factor n=1 Tax=Paenibacillus sp. BR2-3 TaxID=3048494 RepID=UPI003977551B